MHKFFMKIQRVHPIHETIAKLLFLVLPTAALSYFMLKSANNHHPVLENNATEQALYVLAGMAAATVFYSFRFRFITTFSLLAIALYFTYKGIDNTAIGEFDTFFLSIRFLIFSRLFCASVLIGAAFARSRYAHYLIAALALSGSIYIIAKQHADTLSHFLYAILPVVLYSFYIIFAAEQIRNYKDKSTAFWWYMFRRVGLFTLLIGLLGYGVSRQMRTKFSEAIAAANGKGEKGDESGMLKKNKDGNFDLKDYAQLRSNQGRSNELLFAAHIDNYFPGSETPNPLYLTAFYYTKFDTSTETFERDKLIPKNDLFEPDPSKIPMYATRIDSSVIVNGMGTKARNTVEVEIYNKQLSPSTYLAPNTGFFVQPIAIEKDYRSSFRSAYRAKGYVSDLNSAYFVYNAKDPEIQAFQSMRFEVLRKVKNYENEDKAFMNYYTKMPTDAKFQRISQLAKKVAADGQTPVDKVLALRDYFLSKDEDGKALFSYTDNPGVPDIPSASKLMYFLFENHKGYCAYYAGATLFMLRALGIPSRITVGFMTIDRSDKNKGWYWYYADQAHAWVQVYFPGYGWLDFDTTVGNDDAQESPKPDGTPPLQPPHAWFASEGEIIAIDTAKKLIKLKTNQFLFHDKEYKTIQKENVFELDVHIANIIKDSANIDLADLHIGDSATAVSYAEEMKRILVLQNANAETVLEKLPKTIPTDDVYVKKTPEEIKEELNQKAKTEKPFSLSLFLQKAGIALGIILLLFLSIPSLIFYYFKWRSKKAKNHEQQAYWQYNAFSFYLHQLGYFRGAETPLQYANKTIDPTFNTAFSTFMNSYLRIKYSGQKMNDTEQKWMPKFLEKSIALVKSTIKKKKRIIDFLRPLRTLLFFTKQKK